jgi:hypothetical protein
MKSTNSITVFTSWLSCSIQNQAFETRKLTGYKTTLPSGCTTSDCSTLKVSEKFFILSASGAYRLILMYSISNLHKLLFAIHTEYCNQSIQNNFSLRENRI